MELDKVSESIHVELIGIGSLLVRHTQSTCMHLFIYLFIYHLFIYLLSLTVKITVMIVWTHSHRAKIINKKNNFKRYTK